MFEDKAKSLPKIVRCCDQTGLRSDEAGKIKGGSITVPLTSCLTGLDRSVLQIKTKNISCHIADTKSVKPEVNGIVILPTLVFPG
jgi:hypothetical protein